MRQPTSIDQRWSWWESATNGDEPPVYEDEPQVGYYAVRRFAYGKWPKGPFVPARVWIEPGETDPETGELLSPERFCAEIDGKPADPWRTWTWLARRPITEPEYQWLRALSPLLPTKLPKGRR